MTQVKKTAKGYRYRIESAAGRPFDSGGAGGRTIAFKTDLDGGYSLPVQVLLRRRPMITAEPPN